MRNRGYKFVIKCSDEGYWLFCINATWINQMLKERGIKPKEFRKLTFEDIARAGENDTKKMLFREICPGNFWQMCDTLALSMARYKEPKAYHQPWFRKYPLFTCEDVYEHLVEEGFQQEDAIRVMEFVRRGKCHTLSLSRDEFLQLYDVPEDLQEAFSKCAYLPQREEVIREFMDMIERAIKIKQALETAEEQTEDQAENQTEDQSKQDMRKAKRDVNKT